MKTSTCACGAASLAAALLIGGCNAAPSSTGGGKDEGGSRASLFMVPKNQQSRLHIITVEHQPIHRPLEIPAEVTFDERHTSEVVPLVGGTVVRLLAHEGDTVTARQPLLEISSPDSSGNAAALRSAQAALATKRTVLTRDQDLYHHHAISLEELQQAQADVQSAEAAVADARARVRMTGTGGGSGLAVLRSPIDGVVVSRDVAVGDTVDAGGTKCFTISDVSTVWVRGQLYQEDLPRVALGDAASVELPQLDHPLTGHVTYIGAAVDPTKLTVPVRVEVANPKGALKGGQYVDVTIVPAEATSSIVVPAEAVLRDEDNLPFVYVQVGPGKLARRHVRLGGEAGAQGFVITDGLTDGEHVLENGALFVQFAESLGD